MPEARKSLKNTDYVIYVTTRGGRKWKYLKDEKTGWRQVGPEGQPHRMTAEQVLNHLLPALAGVQQLAVRVAHVPSERGVTSPVSTSQS